MIVLVVSFAGLVTYPVEKAFKDRKLAKSELKRKDQLYTRVLMLTPGEKEVLRNFIRARAVSSLEPSSDVVSLVADGLLIQIGEGYGTSYKIIEEVWEILITKPHLFK